MPHQCTTCGHVFPDGSKEMLSGCPDCGGNKFQFAPAGRAGGSPEAADATAESTADGGSDTSGAVSRAAEAVRGWVSSDTGDDRSTPAASDGTQGATDSPAEATDSSVEATDQAVATRNESRSRTESPGSTSTTSSSTTAATSGSTTAADTSLADDFPEWPETARPPTDDEGAPASDEAPDSAGASVSEGEPAGEGAATAEGAGVDSGATVGPDDRPVSGPAVDRDPVPPSSEDAAQASARSDVVSTAELPSRSDDSADGASGASADSSEVPSNGRIVSEPADDRPSLDELREELNDQFESIKIVSPGQYELNLMELYDREEYIVSLQEDGRYVIDVPDSWRDGADE